MNVMQATVTPVEPAKGHPTIFEPSTFLLLTVLCVFGAIIGLQLLVSLGVTPNTSLIGALAAMALARVPIAAFMRYRSIHVQNLAQSAISAATFGAANSLLLPIGIPFLLGRSDLILPIFVGVFLALLLDAYMLIACSTPGSFPRRAPGRRVLRRRRPSRPVTRAAERPR